MIVRELLHSKFNVELIMAVKAQETLCDQIIQELIDLAHEATLDPEEDQEEVAFYVSKCDLLISILDQ